MINDDCFYLPPFTWNISFKLPAEPPGCGPPPITYLVTNETAASPCLAVDIGAFSVHLSVAGSYAKVLASFFSGSTTPTTYKVTLIKLAVNAPRAAGRFVP